MSEKVAIVLLFVYASVIIPNIIGYFAWKRCFDMLFDDEKEDA